MSALDRRGDVIRALSATGEWEWPGGGFLHRHKRPSLTVEISQRGTVELSRFGAAPWRVWFAPSVPDAVVLAACTAAATEAES